MPTLCLIIAIAVVSALPLTSQDPPATAPSVIPVYPGAQKYDPPQYEVMRRVGETLFALPAVPDSWLLREESKGTYLVGATSDQVADFYRKALKATPSSFDAWKALDPRTLSPGRSTAIHYQRYTGAGEIQHVYHWYRREQSGAIVLYELGFANSFDPRDPPRIKGAVTEIGVTTKVYSNDVTLPAPDQRQLGVPVYPGAVYDPNVSATSEAGLSTHVFVTADTMDKVVAFYEARLRLKASRGEPSPGRVSWFFQRYSTDFPGDSLTIQDEDEHGTAYRTRISFSLDRSGAHLF